MASETPTYGIYVDGEWRAAESGETRIASEPATGDPLAELAAGTRADAGAAVEAARAAQPALAELTAFERAELCEQLAAAVREASDDLATWLTRDQGKPIAEARGELEACAREFEHAAAAVTNMETDVLPARDPDKRIYTIRKPHGVVGVITPWNFPANIPAEYLAPAIAGGNAVVWVPAPTTSVIAVKLLERYAETDLPAGALNLVTGAGPVVGNAVVEHEGTDAVGFTGSPETGEAIARAAGTRPTLLELGGNGPVIVLDDADLETAVECTAAGSFGNAGQICSASERVLVHEDVYEAFADRLVERAEAVTLGDPLEEDTDMGPLNNDDVAAKMDDHVADALDKGATLRTGGERASGFPTDRYYEPTVLTGVSTDSLVNHVETFGPIAPLIPFETDEEAIEIANGIDLGLVSAVFTSDLARAHRFSDRIETGIVNVNAASSYWEIHTPFGGHSGKHSGHGRLGGKYTVEELTQTKTIAIDTGTADTIGE
ncbi:MAG: aldehyde dehydrogenase [Haloarculaceae archaeon]